MVVSAGAMLVFGLVMVGRMRLGTLMNAFRLQSIALAVFALSIAYAEHNLDLVISALLILVVKAGIIPQFLVGAAHGSRTSLRLLSYLRATAMSFAGVAVTLAAFAFAHALKDIDGDYFTIAVSLSIVFLGLLLLVSRRDMFGQGAGFLLMENGIFTFGLALTNGMPLLIEVGILFDLVVLLFIVGGFVKRAQMERSTLSTDDLRQLTD